MTQGACGSLALCTSLGPQAWPCPSDCPMVSSLRQAGLPLVSAAGLSVVIRLP
jgi:hypothetical protein